MSKVCQWEGCERGCYGEFCLMHKPRKPIKVNKRPKQQSDKEIAYQEWKETIARPYLIGKFGNRCSCCDLFFGSVKLDIEHTLGKGSHPELKKDLNNMTLMCRPCHNSKTDGLECIHG